MHRQLLAKPQSSPLGLSLGVLGVVCAIASVYLSRPDEQPQIIAGPLDCPAPQSEGETWIARRWIQHGELQLECTHIAGFPKFDLPLARRIGLI